MRSERFDRQSALFPESEQAVLRNSRVAVIGCGGLGSQVVTNLVSAGVGAFTIVDADVVSESNLNRQFVHFGHLGHHKVDSMEEWILDADASAIVEKHRCFIDEDNADPIIADADVVVDCLDSISSRHMLAQACRRCGKVLVHGGVEGMFGQVSVFLPGSSPVLEDVVRGTDGPVHVSYAPAVSVIGALEAEQTVSVLLGRPALEGILLSVDVGAHTMEKHNLAPRF